MRKKLTAKTIDSLPPAQGKRYEVRDELLTGLMLRVSSSGMKVWYVTARIDGRPSRIRIGRYPILSLGDAREAAMKILRDIELGNDPRRGPDEPDEGPACLGDIVPQFIELYARPRTHDWKGTQSILRKFEPLYALPIQEIRRPAVVRVLDQIVADGTPYRANRALAALKKLMAWCVDRGTLEVNPVAGLRPPAKEASRDRVLTDREIALCWAAAEEEGFPFGCPVQLLILTGQRRGEVAGMRWSEIDMPSATWTIPARRAKNATQHKVPLSPQAIDILQSVPRFLDSDFVFTTTGTTAISGFGRLKMRLDAELGSTDWRFHDIRRTVATNMAVARVPPHVIEAVLNHKTGIVSGVAAVYNRYAYADEKREALELWALRVTDLSRRAREMSGPSPQASGHLHPPGEQSSRQFRKDRP